MINVYVVDERELFRRGLRDLLTEVDDIELVGEAPDAARAKADIRSHDPDVVIVDLDLPDSAAIELCRFVDGALPKAQVLISCRRSADERLGDAMLAGAAGFFVTTAPAPEIVHRLRTMHRAGPSLDAGIVSDLFDRVRAGRPRANDPLSALTGRECEILDLLAEGLTNRGIADTLHLSPKTVKNYVSVILKKLGMSTRTEAAVYAARRDALTNAPVS